MGLVRYDFWGSEGKASVSDWEIWTCHKRFGTLFYVLLLVNCFFLNNFFLNNNLLIPPIHPFVIFRLLMWFGIGAIGFREGYEDARTWNTPARRHTAVEGRYRWLASAIIFSEALLCWKYRMDTGHINHDAETPFYIWGPWAVFYGGSVVFWVYLRFKEGHTIKYPLEGKKVK